MYSVIVLLSTIHSPGSSSSESRLNATQRDCQ